MNVSQYIVQYLEDYGIEDIFLVTGGGAMHLNNSIANSKKIKYTCFHHEQAASICAEGYYRSSGKIAVVCCTSGPGGTNCLTGVLGQWLEGIPCLYLSGQVKYETTISSCPEIGLRQLGDQEVNIVDIVKPITKYAKMITNPDEIKIELDKALHIASTGRFGPCWLDVPLNIQGAVVDEKKLLSFFDFNPNRLYMSDYLMQEIAFEIYNAKRPLIIAGHGIKLSKSKQWFLDLINNSDIPVVTTFNGFDIVPSDHKNFVGRIGTIGNRSGNFALQNADLIICLGTRNNIRQVSYAWKGFAKNAKKIIVDIDKAELNKSTIQGDIKVNINVKEFIYELLLRIPFEGYNNWLKWCKERQQKYPIVLEDYRKQNEINPYLFMEALTEQLPNDAIVVAANGTACVTLFQAGIVKENQNIFWNSGCASMGYALPAAIGASIANGNKEVICIEGDGSIQMNLASLQTIKLYKLPIKIFILNNKGYSSIKQTQTNLFDGNLIGCTKETGVSFPDFQKLAYLYDMKYFKLWNTNELDFDIDYILEYEDSCICEVILGDYTFQPKLSSQKMSDGTMVSQPLENMYPFLSKEELESNMIKE